MSNPLALSLEESRMVERAKARLSPRQKLGQLLHPVLWAQWGSPATEEALLAMVEEAPCGAYFMGRGSRSWMKNLVERAQRLLPIKAAVSGDHEFGCRADDGTAFGAAMNAGAIRPIADAVELAYQAGMHTAREARTFGSQWSLGPVFDLNLDPDNPIVSVRSFGGKDPDRAAALAIAYARGMQDHGMAACMKHFPGDGADSRDQHSVTSVNPLPVEEWMRTYGLAFQQGIDAGIFSMMIGHFAWAARSGRHPRTGFLLPATADPRIQTVLLRGELGFQGLILTDAIPMGGLQSHFSREAEYVVECVRAGADMVLFPEDVPGSIDALERALCDGVLKEERVEEALGNVLAFKAKLGLLGEGDSAEPPAPEGGAVELSRQIAERSITLVRDLDELYPLRLAEHSKIVLFEAPLDSVRKHSLIGKELEGGDSLSPVEVGLRQAGYRTVTVKTRADADRELADAAALIYLFFSHPDPRRGSIRLCRAAMDAIDWNRVYGGFPVYFVSFGSPYVGWELGAIHNYACAYSKQPQVMEAYAKALLGLIPFRGELPVELPEQ